MYIKYEDAFQCVPAPARPPKRLFVKCELERLRIESDQVFRLPLTIETPYREYWT